jgi:glycosyltransferase involved in cell wall biosynthesis
MIIEGGIKIKNKCRDIISDKPLITVVTVVFNSVDCVEKTIKSVLSQTYKNIEYIIIDGGSDDGTLDIIKKYDDKINYWLSEKDEGIYDAMNKGIKSSSGEWLCFMNAGDEFCSSDVIEKVFSDSNIVNYDLIYSDTLINGKTVYKCDISDNNVIHQSVIYRKSLHNEVGLYLVSSGLMLSDYIFFMLVKNKRWYKTDFIISNYNTSGVSNKKLLKHISQKTGVDLIFSNISVFVAILRLSFYPIYRKIKQILFKR